MRKHLKNFTYEKIICPLCKNKDYEAMRKKGMFNIFINLSICKKCGFVYLNPRWRKKYYNFFYEKLYDNYFNRKTNHAKERTSYFAMFNRIKKIVKLSKKQNVNILDVGAGTGVGLMLFGEKYYNSKLYAIEPSIKGRRNLNKNNITIISDDVDSNWEKINNKFDLIIMRHVVEHLLNPKKTLSKIFKTISENGYFYIAVPNLFCANSLITKDFFRVVHTFYFSKKNLKFLLKNSGFKIIKITEEDNGEIYIICKKSKCRKFRKPNFNDFLLSKKRLLTLWSIIEQ